jgi:hypothetical protein
VSKSQTFRAPDDSLVEFRHTFEKHWGLSAHEWCNIRTGENEFLYTVRQGEFEVRCIRAGRFSNAELGAWITASLDQIDFETMPRLPAKDTVL